MDSTVCRACGYAIQTSTAARNDGMCVPCARGQTTTCRICGGRAFREMRGVATGDLCAPCRIAEERKRPTSIHAFVKKYGSGDCSLLVRLFELEERHRREGTDAFIALNLIDPPEHYESDVTPANSIAFASSGADGVHFSLITVKGRVSDASPVVVTLPEMDDAWAANYLVGDSLHDFLSLGCTHGFDMLATLSFDWDAAIAVLESPPEDLEDDEREFLRVHREELQLAPWTNIRERLELLERKKRFVLRFGRAWLPWNR
ncbi:MAG TPA: hypothetical protein VF698_09420 [Thermoanaerobaculia bacterium]|jgi:hypothetical protein